MASFLERLREKNKNSKHVGVPPVTNPKLPTKVERDTAEYAARQKAMPNFKFGTGTPLERLQKQMVIAQHPTPTYADAKFDTGKNINSNQAFDEWESKCQAYFHELSLQRAKRLQNDSKS